MNYLHSIAEDQRPLAQQTLALAAIFQSGWVVQQLAEHNTWLSGDAEPLIKSVAQLNPASFRDIFPFPSALKPGLQLMEQTYTRKRIDKIRNAIRYAFSLMQVERHLSRQPEMLTTIREGVEHFAKHYAIDEYWNEPVTYHRFAHLYSETASKLRFRIIVNGNASVMQDELNVARTRASLLAGVRAALLWRQMGGRRWHAVLRRRQIIQGMQLIEPLMMTTP